VFDAPTPMPVGPNTTTGFETASSTPRSVGPAIVSTGSTARLQAFDPQRVGRNCEPRARPHQHGTVSSNRQRGRHFAGRVIRRDPSRNGPNREPPAPLA